MDITFKTKKLEKQCNDYSKLINDYGEPNANKIVQRLKEIKFHDNLKALIDSGSGRCHPLKGNRKDTFAINLSGHFRLIFRITVKGIELIEVRDVCIEEVSKHYD